VSHHFPTPAGGSDETKWVVPEKFNAQLPAVMKLVPPLPRIWFLPNYYSISPGMLLKIPGKGRRLRILYISDGCPRDALRRLLYLGRLLSIDSVKELNFLDCYLNPRSIKDEVTGQAPRQIVASNTCDGTSGFDHADVDRVLAGRRAPNHSLADSYDSTTEHNPTGSPRIAGCISAAGGDAVH
jgi:hypothetical protein